MKCPHCSAETRLVHMDFATSVVPVEVGMCDACTTHVLRFEVPGEADMVIRMIDISVGDSIAEHLERVVGERRRKAMH